MALLRGPVLHPVCHVLAISGSIYLFKPQIESWIDRDFDNLAIKDHPATPPTRSARPRGDSGSTLNGYEVPEDPDNAARVIVSQEGKSTRVYVHPETCKFSRWSTRTPDS